MVESPPSEKAWTDKSPSISSVPSVSTLRSPSVGADDGERGDYDAPTPKNLGTDLSLAAESTPGGVKTDGAAQTPSLFDSFGTEITEKKRHEDSPPGVAASQPRKDLSPDAQVPNPLTPMEIQRLWFQVPNPKLIHMGDTPVALTPSSSHIGDTQLVGPGPMGDTQPMNAKPLQALREPTPVTHLDISADKPVANVEADDEVKSKRDREKYKESERVAEALRKECIYDKDLQRRWE